MGKLSKTLVKSLFLSAVTAYSDESTTEETTDADATYADADAPYAVTGCNDEASPVSFDRVNSNQPVIMTVLFQQT